ncbi:MAG: AAA family ATPase, partial [Alphaproteobacteria bacterium]|nr:AAA family ATPase [Alphaproteobacteria bacterium]
MIRRISALNYKSLRYIDVELQDFHLLVGPNASGKSTFLDVVNFASDLLTDGLETALSKRSPNIYNLVWLESGTEFQIAIEVELSTALKTMLAGSQGEANVKNPGTSYDRARYELTIGLDQSRRSVILHELLILQASLRRRQEPAQREMFPAPPRPKPSIVFSGRKPSDRGAKTIVKKTDTGNDYFHSELTKWNIQFRFGPERPALVNVPEDETKFPVSLWFRKLLKDGVDFLLLNSAAMRRASPPGSPSEFRPDGSNLPFAVENLRNTRPDLYKLWIEHLRTALPDIETIETLERP